MVYAGLSERTVTIHATPPELTEQYPGGRGFGIRLQTDMSDLKIEPPGDKNVPVWAA